MRITCEILGHSFQMASPPRRIVSLVSSATETIFALGCGDRIVGVSPYCARYVRMGQGDADAAPFVPPVSPRHSSPLPAVNAPVVGDYLMAEPELIRATNPDLVLVTAGVQLQLARKLAAAGLPVYVLPLPSSRFGIWENTLTIGALLGCMEEARFHCNSLEFLCRKLAAEAPEPRPRVYVELWLGKFPRTIGGRTFIHDIVELAGGDNIFGADSAGYLPLDIAAAERRKPEVVVFFDEPDYPVDPKALLAERGWDVKFPNLRVVISTVDRGRNMIHDGPSFFETAAWLHGEMAR